MKGYSQAIRKGAGLGPYEKGSHMTGIGVFPKAFLRVRPAQAVHAQVVQNVSSIVLVIQDMVLTRTAYQHNVSKVPHMMQNH